jgi:hypothetical protein
MDFVEIRYGRLSLDDVGQLKFSRIFIPNKAYFAQDKMELSLNP